MRRLDGKLCQFLSIVHVLVEPQFQRRPHKTRHQSHGVTGVQALLDLTLELGVEHLGRKDIAGPRKHVLRHQLYAFGQQRMELDETLDRGEQTVTQSTLVGATGAGRNEVHVALTHGLPIFGEGHAPSGTLAFCEVVALRVGKTLAIKHRYHRFPV